MAALALASSEADDVFEAVASHLRRPPFSRTLTAQDLRDGRDLKTLLYEVCADIDAARAPRDAADAAALLKVLGAPVDEETTARDILESDRGTIIASLHWCLRDRAARSEQSLALPRHHQAPFRTHKTHHQGICLK